MFQFPILFSPFLLHDKIGCLKSSNRNEKHFPVPPPAPASSRSSGFLHRVDRRLLVQDYFFWNSKTNITAFCYFLFFNQWRTIQNMYIYFSHNGFFCTCSFIDNFLNAYFHGTGPLGQFSHRVTMFVCLCVCLSAQKRTSKCHRDFWSKSVFLKWYLFYEERRDIPWNIA